MTKLLAAHKVLSTVQPDHVLLFSQYKNPSISSAGWYLYCRTPQYYSLLRGGGGGDISRRSLSQGLSAGSGERIIINNSRHKYHPHYQPFSDIPAIIPGCRQHNTISLIMGYDETTYSWEHCRDLRCSNCRTMACADWIWVLIKKKTFKACKSV